MSKDYVDNVLIKLKREYQKDEVLSAIIKQNSEHQIKIGMLQSEIQHLENEILLKEQAVKQDLADYKTAFHKEMNKDVKIDNTVIQLKAHIKKQDKLIENLRKSISELASKSLNK